MADVRVNQSPEIAAFQKWGALFVHIQVQGSRMGPKWKSGGWGYGGGPSSQKRQGGGVGVCWVVMGVGEGRGVWSIGPAQYA